MPAHRLGLEDLGSYYADDESTTLHGSVIEVLSCACGEFGCWPLLTSVIITSREAIWTNFRQPHRPERDYTSFGAWRFDRANYDAALRAANALIGPGL